MAEGLKRWGPLALVLIAAAAVYASGLHHYVSPHFLKARHDQLKAFVAAHYWASLFGFTLFFALITSVAMPGAVFAQLTGGFLFGAWLGGTAIALAATVGALAIYGVTRTAFGEALRRRLPSDHRAIRRLQAGLDQQSFWFLLSVRLAPVVPFVLVNIASGLARIPLRSYVLATFLGTLPTNLVYASIGADSTAFSPRGASRTCISCSIRASSPRCSRSRRSPCCRWRGGRSGRAGAP